MSEKSASEPPARLPPRYHKWWDCELARLSPPDFPYWTIDLFGAVAERLLDILWFPGRVMQLAPWIAKTTTKAWDCFEAGAPGALFDVLAVFDAAGIAPPPEIAFERDALIGAALRGGGESRGQGARAPLAAHDTALRQRLRAEVVEQLLLNAEIQQQFPPPAPLEGAGAEDGESRRDWPEWPPPEAKACCERAREMLGETMVGWRALYDNFREMRALSREFGAAWPGPFYLPSEAVCERFGLEHGLKLIRGGWAGTDAPPWWELTG
jgi:hypothetical protein